eukprot:TRINITY_DN5570_c0_g3_i1.p1 TRINITY_DN5570_c0_g3~~TRINITY_DN5570_c0_g3_i1.p1  ORF type:complete len:279 (+),score=85.53 TRINITY_DN5570_c0_g3_i1:73-837(+)
MRAAAFLGLVGGASATISFSRTVTQAPSWASGTITIAGDACKSSDKYGSNDCTLSWGQSYTANIDASLTQDIPGGTASADLKIDGLIPFKPSCKICGENCTITIPIVSKSFSFYPGDCPIKAGAIKNSTSVAIPAAPSGLPKTSVKGTVTVSDASGAAIAKVDVTANIDSSVYGPYAKNMTGYHPLAGEPTCTYMGCDFVQAADDCWGCCEVRKCPSGACCWMSQGGGFGNMPQSCCTKWDDSCNKFIEDGPCK